MKAPYQEKPLAHGTRAAKWKDTVTLSGDKTYENQWERGQLSVTVKVLVSVAQNL